MMSKAQWDADGDEGYEQDIIGTGPYRYAGRTYGVDINYELLPDHWRRNDPAPTSKRFKSAGSRNQLPGTPRFWPKKYT